MKKFLGFAIVMVLVAGVASAATIVGTKHDMNTAPATYKGTNANSEVCIYCHTPHNAASGAAQLVPLWNHTTTSTASFTLYTSGTLNATVGQPGGASKACLSCHDGTVNVDAFGGQAGTAPKITGTALLGTDLSNDHPVSFTYDATLVSSDPGLVTPASASQVVAGVPLFSTKVECASCHDVHVDTNPPFLRMSNSGSALCLKCHLK